MERQRKLKRAGKNEKSERAGKNEGRLGESRPLPQSPLVFFPALSLALFFARAPLSERLEQAKMKKEEANSFTEILSEERGFGTCNMVS